MPAMASRSSMTLLASVATNSKAMSAYGSPGFEPLLVLIRFLMPSIEHHELQNESLNKF